jgi:FkbM family methyltransferase
MVDVATEWGRRAIAQRVVWASDLVGMQRVTLSFELTEPHELEYRVYAMGTCQLLVADDAIVRTGNGDAEVPARRDDVPFLRLGDVKVSAARYDDIYFLDEVFKNSVYKLISDADICFIDVGMNVGLVSLLFASMSNVHEVHAFEPFPETYARAQVNLSLNPSLRGKVKAHNFGLGGQDERIEMLVGDGIESGSMNMFYGRGDRSVSLDIRGAAATLRPILESAIANGRQIIAKIDCEGSEFAIFKSLEDADLFRSFTAIMVEWHRMFPGKDQSELIAPLRKAGFIVIDVSPEQGNGFFYAVRAAVQTETLAAPGLLKRIFA